MDTLRRGLRALPGACGARWALAGSLVLAFGILGVLLSIWLMATYRPFAGRDFGRVVLLQQISTQTRDAAAISASYSVMVKERSRSLAAIARVRFATLNIRTQEGLEPVQVALVSPEFLGLFEAPVIRGRGILAADEAWAGGAVGMVSETFWNEHLRRAGDVLGSSISTSDPSLPSFPIVGVLGNGFRGFGYFTNRRVDLVLPLPIQDKERQGRNHQPCTALALLAPGANEQTVRRELALISADLVRSGLMKRGTVVVSRPVSVLFLAVQRRLLLAGIVTGISFLLVLVCAAGVLQIRVVDRIGELRIRQSLGASRNQIFRMLLGENTWLFTFSGLLGASLSGAALAWLGPLLGEGLGLPPSLDSRTVCWLPLILLPLAPCMAAAATAAQWLTLRPVMGSEAVPVRYRWTPRLVALRRALVVAQGAAATMLALAAVASIHSLVAIEQRDVGFASREVWSARVTLSQLASDHPRRWEAYFEALVEEVKRLPGVLGVGVLRAQMGEESAPSLWTSTGTDPSAGPILARGQYIHWSLFRELGLPVLKGRMCGPSTQEPRPAALINEAMAARYWPDGHSVGSRLQPGELTIVGIVPSVRRSRFDVAPVPEVFHCNPFPQMHLLLRCSRGGKELAASLIPIARRLSRDVTVDEIAPVEELLDRALRPSQVLAGFLGSLGAMSVLGSALAMFAIASMVVSQRRTELAIRIAVGADPVVLGRRIEAEATLVSILGSVTGYCLFTASAPYLAALGTGLDLPLPTAAVSLLTMLLVTWIAVKKPALYLRRLNLLAELKHE